MSYYNTDEQPIEQSEEVEPPPIPKRKLKPRKQSEMEELAADESIREPVAVSPIKEKTSSPSKSKKVPAEHLLEPAKEFSILELVPDTIIGKTVVLKGELAFEKLLRIDGRFEGDLVSNGSLIVGPSGIVIGHIEDFSEVLVDGRVYGDIMATSLIMRSNSQVYGNVNTKNLIMQTNSVLVGYASAHPHAPQEPTVPADIANAIKRRDAARRQEQEEAIRRTADDLGQLRPASTQPSVSLPALTPTISSPPSQPSPPSSPPAASQPSPARNEVAYTPTPPSHPPPDNQRSRKSFFGKK